MKRWILISMLVCSSTVSNAWADLRVLFRFDTSGHYVHRIVEVAAREKLRQKSSVLTRSGGTLSNDLPLTAIATGRGDTQGTGKRSIPVASGPSSHFGYALLVWYSDAGEQIARTLVPDPRVAHSPSHIDGIDASVTGLDSGAWLATGPDDAVQVALKLPASHRLSLAAEQWLVSLNRD